MDIKRRSFLAGLATLALDPERLLWVPGKKLISIPSPVVLPDLVAQIISAQMEVLRPKLAELIMTEWGAASRESAHSLIRQQRDISFQRGVMLERVRTGGSPIA